MEKLKCKELYNILIEDNPSPKGELIFSNPLECLIAVLLSAQCTDKRVNIVTKELFKKFKSASDYAVVDLDVLKGYINSINFYNNKAKNIKSLAESLVRKYNGKVPSTLEELASLNGVGRKTAQVVLVEAFNKPAVPVDTHIFRVCNRLGITTNAKNVAETENAIRNCFDEEVWANLHKLLVLHGRYICKAKKPDCENCKLKYICEKNL